MLPYIYPFGIAISMYKLMLLVGVIIIIIHYVKRRDLIGFTPVKAGVCGFCLVSMGFIGMKILYLSQNFDKFQENRFSSGGLFFYGAVFFVPITIPLWAKVFKVGAKALADFGAPDMLVAIGTVRIGCLCAGCCGGIVVEGVRIPVQLIEASFDFLILGRLLNREVKYEGELYPRFMIEYGAMRFFVEFIRASEKNVLGLSVDQWLSIVSVIVGLGIYQHLKKKGERKSEKYKQVQ